MPLDREEYVEQAYFFRALTERMQQQLATQDLLVSVRHELLATCKLPMAVDFMASELRHTGGFATAMARLAHYFSPFQTFVMEEAEDDHGRLEFNVALEILYHEANYRCGEPTPQGIFLYQFESLCRNRLGYDRGLTAMSADPSFDAPWREWVLTVRRQIGLVDLADLLYVRSEHYARTRGALDPARADKPALFGEKEGRIALANRRKDPLLLFAALQRHLGYPIVPRPKKPDETQQLLPTLMRRLERLEQRLKLLEEEQKSGAIDLAKLMPPPE